MGFMSCIVNFGTVTLQSSINKLGTNIITAHTAARKIFDILDVVLYIIGNAVTTFVSQNLGAKRIDRVKTGVRAGIIINTIATTIIILIGFPASPLLIRLIAGTNDPAVIDPAVMYIRISVCCFICSPLCNAGYGKKDRTGSFQYHGNGRKNPCCSVPCSCTWLSRCCDHRTDHLGSLHAHAYDHVPVQSSGENVCFYFKILFSI